MSGIQIDLDESQALDVKLDLGYLRTPGRSGRKAVSLRRFLEGDRRKLPSR